MVGKEAESGMCKDDAEHLLAAGEQRMRALRAEAESYKKDSEAAQKVVVVVVEVDRSLWSQVFFQQISADIVKCSWSRKNCKTFIVYNAYWKDRTRKTIV